MFIFRMAWRETRAAWRHFLYFFVCIVLGVGALVGVALFGANLERTVTREARGLLGGDLEIRLTRAISVRGQEALTSLVDRGMTLTHASELVAMASTLSPPSASASGRSVAPTTQIVELKAVESSYPLYGHLEVDPDRALPDVLTPSSELCRMGGDTISPCLGALVQESLLIRMNLHRGDRVKIGQATFVITGVIRKEPDRMATAFSLGPRVLISQAGLAHTELVKVGSRVRERYLIRLPAEVPVQPVLYELRGTLTGESARVSSYRDAQPQLKQFLEQLSRYLGLVGLTALFVGGIGVATSIQAFLREKLQPIAILKTVGADSRTIVMIYLIQALLLAVLGSAVGVLVGIVVQAWLPLFLGGLFAGDVVSQIDLSTGLGPHAVGPILKGCALGLLTTLLFCLWPLLGVRDIRPALIFRREASMQGATDLVGRASSKPAIWKRVIPKDLLRATTVLTILAGLTGLTIWQAGSWRVALLFIGALLVAVAVLTGAAWLLMKLVALLPEFRSLAIRQAVGSLRRPGSQAPGITVSVGIGVMVMVTVSLLEGALVRQVGESRPTDSPSFFFIDIQPDQKDPFLDVLHARTNEVDAHVTPLVRSRLAAINGARVTVEPEQEREAESKEDRRKNWYLTREYVLTFLAHLPKDNEIVEGVWWQTAPPLGKAWISIEEDVAKHLGVTLGSTLAFDIQGSVVSGEVTSIRKVNWGNFSTNFYIVFSPGALDGAPFTYVATVRVSPQEEVPLQQAVVAAFPNITAINVGDVLDGFARVLDRLSLAIRAVALFCLVAGAVVMAAALATTRYRRLYESMVLKAVGATRGLIARAFVVEYALLGFMAGLIGIGLASSLSWIVLKYFLESPWFFQPQVLSAGLLLTVVMTVVVGFLTTFRLLGRRPLSVLRHE